MTRGQAARLKAFEGRRVCVALADGSRLDDCQLVSAGRHRARNVWLFANGIDCFISPGGIVDVWEAG